MLGAFPTNGSGGIAALAAAAFPMEPIESRRNYNREFQKAEVVRFLVHREPLAQMHHPLTISAESFEIGCEEGYMVYLYVAEEHEYEEGFGPSVTVRIGNDETTWKRSRNKWNPFEKIRTVPGVDNSSDFKVIWDRSHCNSYYVTERMYYYLDREKHRDKFRHLRAKLYITRLQQRAGQSFLLQFIIERAAEDGEATGGALTSSSASLTPSLGSNFHSSPANSNVSSARSSRDMGSKTTRQWARLSGGSNTSGSTSPHSSSVNTDVPSPRTDSLFAALGSTHLSASSSSNPTSPHLSTASHKAGFMGQSHGQPHSQQAFGVSNTLMDHYGQHQAASDSSRIQSFPPMFAAPAQRFYQPGMVGTPSNPQLDYATAAAIAAANQNMLLTTPLTLSPHHPLPSDEVANFQSRLQLAQHIQFQQLLAQQAIEYQHQRDVLFLQQLREQAAMARAGASPNPANSASANAAMGMSINASGAPSPTSPSSSNLGSSPSSTTSTFSTNSTSTNGGSTYLAPRSQLPTVRHPTTLAQVPQALKSRSLDPQIVNAWRSESGTIKRQHDSYAYSDLPESASKRRSTEIQEPGSSSSSQRHSYGPILTPGGSGASTPTSTFNSFAGINLAVLAQEAENARANDLANALTATSATPRQPPAPTPNGTTPSPSSFKVSIGNANTKRFAFAPSQVQLAAIAQEAAAMSSDGSSESLNIESESIPKLTPSSSSECTAMVVDTK